MNSPLQGSFFTRNSSRAIQPPPTRTITVLRKIRTRRSCCESPNYGEERERVRHVDRHSRQERKKKRWCKYGDHTGLVELSRPCNSTTHTQILCVNFRNHFFSMLHRFTQRGLLHILRFHSHNTSYTKVIPTGLFLACFSLFAHFYWHFCKYL